LRLSPTIAPYSFGWRRLLASIAVTSILCIFCGLGSYAKPQSSDDEASSTISGTVTNSVTHEPIGRALVYTADERSATFTDDHGHFELPVPEVKQQPGGGSAPIKSPVQLQAKKPGYLTDYGIESSAMIGGGAKDVTLTLIPEALIAGQVKFPSADAADYVEVQLYRREVREGFARWEPLIPVRTRADGEFRFAELRAGEYKVFTHEAMEHDPLATVPNGPAYGFPPRFFAAARDFAAADTIQVKAGETVTANIAPERQRYYEIRIPVIRQQSGQASGLEVSVHSQGHRGPGFELGYDPGQNAIRGSLPNGSYSIEAAMAWYQPDSGTGTTTITVANGPVNGPPLALTPNVSIEYNVQQDLGAAGSSRMSSPSVYVSLRPADEFAESRGGGGQSSSSDGPPVLTGVKPGRYWVLVNPTSSDIYVASVSSGGKDLLASPLVVPFGASVPPIEITLARGPGEIEISIEGKNSGPQEGISTTGGGGIIASRVVAGPFDVSRQTSVYCIPLSGSVGAVREISRLDNGKYYVSVPPGDYRILAFERPPQLEYRNPAAMRPYEGKGQTVHVASGQKSQVTVQLIKSE
jgi:hypothetical protein